MNRYDQRTDRSKEKKRKKCNFILFQPMVKNPQIAESKSTLYRKVVKKR